MSVSLPDDFKKREAAYLEIMRLMENPTEQLLDELRTNLPHYLCDNNSSCQRVALSICDLFFKHSDDINYAEFADILIHNCFDTNPDQTSQLLEQCIKADYGNVSPLLYENITNLNNAKRTISILSVVMSYLATLNLRDSSELNDIIKTIEPLVKSSNQEIRNQAISVFNSAKIIKGEKTMEINSPSSAANSTRNKEYNFANDTWPKLLESESWKERKEGLQQLLSLIIQFNDSFSNQQTNEKYPLINIDRYFLLKAAQEKHIACQNLVLEIIENLGYIYKEKMLRKLRDYANVVVSMMSQKKNTRLSNLQSAFDSLALNVSSPYEQPFFEILNKMMTNSNVRLREEALLFITRNPQITRTSQINDLLQKLSSDPSLQIREMASSIINSSNTNNSTIQSNSITQNENGDNDDVLDINPDPENNEEFQSNTQILPGFNGNNESIKKIKKRGGSLQSQWAHWIDNETLEMLSSGQWMSVTKGLEMLKTKYESERQKSTIKVSKSIVVSGLISIFIGKTFTPKVMSNICQNVLFYVQDKTIPDDKLTDDAATVCVNFCIDKIIDKHNESTIFTILDELCDTVNDQFVFDILYNQLSQKNPNLVQKIIAFFCHRFSIVGVKVNANSFASFIKPMLTHGDQNVRKNSVDCMQYFPNEIIQDTNATNTNSQQPASDIQAKQNKSTELISSKLIQMIAKASSILDCRRGLEEIENILTDTLNKNGRQSVENKELSELFARLRTWFKDSNTNIVLSVSKVVFISIKVVKDINGVPIEFLNDVVLLLNFVNKGIRQQTILILNELYEMMKNDFINRVLIPAFERLNGGGRKAAVVFMRDLQFDMTVEIFSPVICDILADKSEDFRNAALPIVQKFIKLEGSVASLKKGAEQFPPAKKKFVIEQIVSLDPNENQKVPDEKNQNTDQSSKPSLDKKDDENVSDSKIPKRNFGKKNESPDIEQFMPKNLKGNESKIAIFKPKGNSRLRQQKQAKQPLGPLKEDDNDNKHEEEEDNEQKEEPIELTHFVNSLNNNLSKKVTDVSLYIYQWISDLNSSDIQTIDMASKAILKHIKSNSKIFTPHLDPLAVSLICKLHSLMMKNPIPENSCKTIILCIQNVIRIFPSIPKDYIQQIIIEYLDNCSSSKEKCKNEFNDLILSLIDLQTMTVYSSLLTCIFDFTDKSPNALDTFKKCSAKVLQIGNNNDVCSSLIFIDKCYDAKSRKSLLVDKFGATIVQYLDSYVSQAADKFGEVINTVENRKKFLQNSTILPMITPLNGAIKKKESLSHLPVPNRSGSPTKPASPHQKGRIARPNQS